ncbi:MAG: hypothetical protein HY609_01135, partial [Deltaproteobacteria bacterium]|nr:hypothetical protein [Deltaproteobacteria bacterium]
MKNILLLFLVLVSGPWSLVPGPAFAADSLSDLSVEELDKEQAAASARNPFAPSELTGQIDVESLTLEGFLIGDDVSLGLISGQVVHAEMRLGPFLIVDILPGEIVLDRTGEEFHLKMEGFLQPLQALRTAGYQIE